MATEVTAWPRVTLSPSMSRFIRPPRLQPGDLIAAVSLSSGAAALFPARYEAGKRQLAQQFGLSVIEAPHALASDAFLRQNPQARAADLHWALTNPEVKGMISTIGGDDSVRVLPHLDPQLIRDNPKVFMGFSDTTNPLLAFLSAGVHAFHGPAFMTDLAETGGMKPFVSASLRAALFEAKPHELKQAPEWTEEFLDWADPNSHDRARRFVPSEGWRWLQGSGASQGHLLGGSLEVLQMLNGTRWWPAEDLWRGAILFLETSEEVPPPRVVAQALSNYGAQGILNHAQGLLLARPMRYSLEDRFRLDEEVLRVLAEYGRSDLPVVTNLDIGHTSPQLTLPLGVETKIDVTNRRIQLLASAVS